VQVNFVLSSFRHFVIVVRVGQGESEPAKRSAGHLGLSVRKPAGSNEECCSRSAKARGSPNSAWRMSRRQRKVAIPFPCVSALSVVETPLFADRGNRRRANVYTLND
jgi:hypothetical protein